MWKRIAFIIAGLGASILAVAGAGLYLVVRDLTTVYGECLEDASEALRTVPEEEGRPCGRYPDCSGEMGADGRFAKKD